jgi:hypothetical protein
VTYGGSPGRVADCGPSHQINSHQINSDQIDSHPIYSHRSILTQPRHGKAVLMVRSQRAER